MRPSSLSEAWNALVCPLLSTVLSFFLFSSFLFSYFPPLSVIPTSLPPSSFISTLIPLLFLLFSFSSSFSSFLSCFPLHLQSVLFFYLFSLPNFSSLSLTFLSLSSSYFPLSFSYFSILVIFSSNSPLCLSFTSIFSVIPLSLCL